MTGSSDAITSSGAASPQGRVRWGRILAGLLVLILLIPVVIVLLPPSSLFTYALQKRVHELTGRDLKVANSTYVIRETVHVELNDVTLSGPPGATAPDLFTGKSIRVSFPLREALSGNLQLTRLDLEGPVLNLKRDAQGHGNWTITDTGQAALPSAASQSTAAPEPAASSTEAAPTGTSSTLAGILALPVTNIRNGTLLYTDEASSTDLRLDTIDARLVMDRTYGGAAAQGTARYANEPLSFDLAVADAQAAFAGRSTNMTLAIDSRFLTARLNGDGAIGELPMLAGEIDARTPSARDLAGWLGFDDAVPQTLGAFSFKGRADAASGRMQGSGQAVLQNEPLSYDLILENIRDVFSGKSSELSGKISSETLLADLAGRISLGEAPSYEGAIDASTPSISRLAERWGASGTALQGWGPGLVRGQTRIASDQVTFDTAAFDADGKTGTFTGTIALADPRPRVTGKLEVSMIDVDALMGRAPSGGGPSALEAMPIEEEPDEGFASTYDALAAELDELERAQGPAPAFQLEATAQPAYWSNDPIDLAALRALDLDLDVTARAVRYGALDIKDARVKTALNNGELAANINSVTIGKGKGSGIIDLKARGTQHAGSIALKLQGVEAEPVSYELSGRRLLSGPADVDIRTSATGRSMRQIVSTLDGGARFDMKNGRLRGWDIERMLNQFWNYGGWGFNPQRSTPFDKLNANYTIKSGVMRSAPDLNMSGPAAQLRSRGDVIVPAKRINQELRIQNLLFPITVKGDWTKSLWVGPSFLAGLAPTPGAALETMSSPPMPASIPADLQAKIERVLGSEDTARKLPASARSFLKSLVTSDDAGPAGQ